jgi:hypothetical protein
MTPKEAVEILLQAETVVSFAVAFGYDSEVPTLSQYRQALATITHHLTPRTEAPTVEEVGENDQCLVVYLNGFAGVEYGKYLRRKWQNGVQWLPIPQAAV